MAKKIKSPLKAARIELDLSRSELASLLYPRGEDRNSKAELAQEIALCEAGLRNPDDPALKFLFQRLAEQGYKDLKGEQEEWIDARKVAMEKDK